MKSKCVFVFVPTTKTGVGARFKETREFKGKKMSTILEVTEFEEDERIRLVSDTQGTFWDSVFMLTGS